jgi:NADH dehydrogenase [ubiquinone] 1 alpha subcomplex assembly factor 7
MSPQGGPDSVAPSRRGAPIDAKLAAVAADGLVRFDQFVDIALYDPEFGYYAQPALQLGQRGDYYTASHLSPVFGRTIGRRLVAEWQSAGCPSSWRIMELGPGDGTLAVDLLGAVARRIPEGVRVEYVAVERSEPLRKRVLERVAECHLPRNFSAFSLPTAGADGAFCGAVIASELFDALPFRRFVRRTDGWREEFIRLGPPTEVVDRAVRGELSLPSSAAEGSVLEVSEMGRAVLRSVADHLQGGAMIVFDYGAEEGSLLHRGDGTLVAVRAHHPVANPLTDPGTADLSTFVNFTRVRQWAKECGWVETAFRPQAEALGAWGVEAESAELLAEAASPEEEVRRRLQVKNLLFNFPNFHVLELIPADRVTS